MAELPAGQDQPENYNLTAIKVSDACIACKAQTLLGSNSTNFQPSANSIAYSHKASTVLICGGDPVSEDF